MTTFRCAALCLIAALGLPWLAACAPGADSPAAEASGSAADGLTITNARLVLPPVAGRPAAVYFDLSYAGAPGVSIAGVTVEGAGMAMIHDYAESKGAMKMVMADKVPLDPGAPVRFAPGGLHVMAMEPAAQWKAGDMVNVTLALSDGTSRSIAAVVRAAGDER